MKNMRKIFGFLILGRKMAGGVVRVPATGRLRSVLSI